MAESGNALMAAIEHGCQSMLVFVFYGDVLVTSDYSLEVQVIRRYTTHNREAAYRRHIAGTGSIISL